MEPRCGPERRLLPRRRLGGAELRAELAGAELHAADNKRGSIKPSGYSDLALEQLLDASDSLEALVEARPRLLKELAKLGRYNAAIKVQELVPIGPQELQDKLAVMKNRH